MVMSARAIFFLPREWGIRTERPLFPADSFCNRFWLLRGAIYSEGRLTLWLIRVCDISNIWLRAISRDTVLPVSSLHGGQCIFHHRHDITRSIGEPQMVPQSQCSYVSLHFSTCVIFCVGEHLEQTHLCGSKKLVWCKISFRTSKAFFLAGVCSHGEEKNRPTMNNTACLHHE